MPEQEAPYDPYIPSGQAGAQQGAGGNARTQALQAVSCFFDVFIDALVFWTVLGRDTWRQRLLMTDDVSFRNPRTTYDMVILERQAINLWSKKPPGACQIKPAVSYEQFAGKRVERCLFLSILILSASVILRQASFSSRCQNLSQPHAPQNLRLHDVYQIGHLLI
jgi:hypothetical protein